VRSRIIIASCPGLHNQNQIGDRILYEAWNLCFSHLSNHHPNARLMQCFIYAHIAENTLYRFHVVRGELDHYFASYKNVDVY
jgi:hypothetical protein